MNHLDLSSDSVCVVVTTYNHAHFLGDALKSIICQTRVPDEIIVVDDGSDDDPANIVRQFEGVTLVRQPNSGLSLARNTGMMASRSRFLIFLDADDVLSPNAIADGIECFRSHPGAGFVYGAHRRVDASLRPISPVGHTGVCEDPYLDFLRGNPIGMHATVMYDRALLVESGGFDPSLRRSEDYDVFLRLSRRNRVVRHDSLVAEYRIHRDNMSKDPGDMLRSTLAVHNRYRPIDRTSKAYSVWRDGKRAWKAHYVGEIFHGSMRGASKRSIAKDVLKAFCMSPPHAANQLAQRSMWTIARTLPKRLSIRLAHMIGHQGTIPLKAVRFGDFNRLRPVDTDFGYNRGTPVDRFYVEEFLNTCCNNIHGRVLEVGDAAYSTHFGSGITHQDILHVSRENPDATIVGDVSEAGVLPDETFDCIIFTQTLHLIYDMQTAVMNLHRALKPGGVLLLTVPGITSIDRGQWKQTWYWSLTGQSATRLFGGVFGETNIVVSTHGNVYAAVCFLEGLALEEVERQKLGYNDPSYPIIVTVRATRCR